MGKLMHCIICNDQATKIKVIDGIYIGFCKNHSIKDYNVKVF